MERVKRDWSCKGQIGREGRGFSIITFRELGHHVLKCLRMQITTRSAIASSLIVILIAFGTVWAKEKGALCTLRISFLTLPQILFHKVLSAALAHSIPTPAHQTSVWLTSNAIIALTWTGQSTINK